MKENIATISYYLPQNLIILFSLVLRDQKFKRQNRTKKFVLSSFPSIFQLFHVKIKPPLSERDNIRIFHFFFAMFSLWVYICVLKASGKTNESFMWTWTDVCFVAAIIRSSSSYVFLSDYRRYYKIFLFSSSYFLCVQSENIYITKPYTINFHHSWHYDKKYWVSLSNSTMADDNTEYFCRLL